MRFKREGDAIILIGETKGHLGQSIYLREIEGKEEGAAPPVDLAVEKKNGDFVRGLIEAGRVDTVHDVSDGGLLVALAEMAHGREYRCRHRFAERCKRGWRSFIGEDQARYLLAVAKADANRILADANSAGVPAFLLGTTGGDKIKVADAGVSLAELKRAHESWFPAYMAATTTRTDRSILWQWPPAKSRS